MAEKGWEGIRWKSCCQGLKMDPFFFLKHFGYTVYDLHGRFPVTILMPFNKKIRAEVLA